ncbi:MAG: tetraacyldisaccharide 4'-kinase, partial [Flavobacteriaceae bacterium]|nr:tetraacyldisaccharide 4'-kinase [Bacteroidia bacterium]NNL61373.1 tetraacyldisaccharide 4'-kinase [Flavobacteriaceae bacterium]
TPMVEYIVNLLKNDFSTATLSRGYKRKTKGFIKADDHATSQTIGDEPLQFHKKLDNIIVAVDANRCNGISELMKDNVEVVILDDAFQHRKVDAGLNILLTTYSNPYYSDYVLPTGNLREPRSGAKRADIIVVTKCPIDITESEKMEIIEKIRPKQHQKVFFSWISYDELPSEILDVQTFTLVTGIANPSALVKYLKSKQLKFDHLQFKDHHEFGESEIENLKKKDIILTTEKDYMRLKDHIDPSKLYYLPIKIELDKPKEFDKKLKDFVSDFKKH